MHPLGYWGFSHTSHSIGLVAPSINYAGVPGIYVLDRRSGAETSRNAVIPGARRTTLPALSSVGRTQARALGVAIRIDRQPRGTTIHARLREVEINVDIPLPPGHQSLAVVVPRSPAGFSTP
ncbi:DUF2804 family protein [Mycobacteroides salmoniphilum]|uniref:DUF2804 family protein n=1 Tax=Mycobacteroides salmoniphilum TaxID=404941 RepID=UPI003B9684F6